jgi:serine/threonine protein kinase
MGHNELTGDTEGRSVDAGSVVFDRYQLEERIGVGGMGVVWRATDLLLHQPVALKRVSLAGVDDQHAQLARDRALREARLAARLRAHRHVVAIYDVRVDDGDVWLVLEYLPSRSLAQVVDKRGPLSPGEVARIGAQVADALAVAHAAGIEHRDVTPGNVLITDDGTARLTDFGISHLAGDIQLTQTGVISGTFAYLAPEVARIGKSSPASDVFSLGSTLYFALEGQPPFGAADNALELLRIVSVGIIRPPTAAGELTPLLLRLLALDPATRPDAATARDQLTEFATQLNAPVPVSAATPQGVPPWAPRRPAPEPAPADLPTYGAPASLVAPPHEPGEPPPPGSGSPPDATGSPAPGSKRMWWLVAGAVLAVLALAGGLLIAFWPWVSGSSTAAPPPIGDPRTADPCSLLNTGSAQRFGQATMYPDFGYPQSCRIDIKTDGQAYVVLRATLDVGWPEPPDGTAERLGKLTIYRAVASGGMCDRTVVVDDQSRVYVRALAGGGATTDLCAVADVGTQSAVFALSGGSLPRREIIGPRNALIWLDTCTLLDQPTLAQVPGLDPTRRFAGVAGWLCIWGSNPAFTGEPTVKVAVDRTGPLSGQPVQIGGRSAQVFPGGDKDPGTCMVDLVQRSYTGTSGNSRVEVLEFTVFLGTQQPADAACRSATALVAAAAPKLPAPS